MNQPADYREQVRRSFDGDVAHRYREWDQQSLAPGHGGAHYCFKLRQLCESFGRPITVLDLGCGTGRYFHCLRGVKRLVGIDLSAHMLQQAQESTNQGRLSTGSVELICGDVMELELPLHQFDLVYSVGVLGEYSPFDERVARRLRDLLLPGGALFVTAVDSASRISVPEKGSPALGRRLARKLLPVLPLGTRRLINRQLSPFYMSHRQLHAVFAAAGFDAVDMAPFVHPAGWRGTHWDCLARHFKEDR
jgi:SAM-dependent methyltransferase